MNYPQRPLKLLLDAVFPIRCIGCGVYDTYLCNPCLATIGVRDDFECIGCKKPVAEGKTCTNCRGDFKINRLFVITDYNDKQIKKALKLIKYNFIKDLSEPLITIVGSYADKLKSKIGFNIFAGNPLLVPVPLHKKRLNWRGFNQADILAEKISVKYGAELGLNILIRSRNNKPQAEIEDKKSRIDNAKDSFSCSVDLNGRNIILIDDVCTTGATLNECAKMLTEKGAGNIGALVIARG